MATEARLRANKKYDAENTKQYKFKYNIKHDADIIAKLDSVANKQDYIRKLIREDLARQQAPAED